MTDHTRRLTLVRPGSALPTPGTLVETPWTDRRGRAFPVRRPAAPDDRRFDWWLPLAALARAARDDGVPWLLLLDEFDFVGLANASAPNAAGDIHVYQHCFAAEVYVDPAGRPFAVHSDRRRKLGFRFEPTSPRSAVWACGLPHFPEAPTLEPRRLPDDDDLFDEVDDDDPRSDDADDPWRRLGDRHGH